MHGISGPCQTTQLEDIGLQGLLSKFKGFILIVIYNIQIIIKNCKSIEMSVYHSNQLTDHKYS